MRSTTNASVARQPHVTRESFLLARQPILDRSRRVFGYELLCRPTEGTAFDGKAATARVLAKLLTGSDTREIFQEKQAFINLTEEMLFSDVLGLLPKDRVVLELLEDIPVDDRIVTRVMELKTSGFSLALDDVVSIEKYQPLLSAIDVIKVEIPAFDEKSLDKTVRHLRLTRAKLLAEKVETEEVARQCGNLGFEYFQGYFYAKPEGLSEGSLDPQEGTLMRLLGLLMADADPPDVETTIKHSPELCMGLLRLVNSAASGLPRKIDSVRQAVVILGSAQLRRWLQLLLFARRDPTPGNPLLEMVSTRARLLELLARELHRESRQFAEMAFTCGMVSLMDTLLRRPIERIAEDLGLAEAPRAAVLHRAGPIGQLLDLAERLETGSFAECEAIIKDLRLAPQTVLKAQSDAMAWAVEISRAT